MQTQALIDALQTTPHPELVALYGEQPGEQDQQRERYAYLLRRFERIFPGSRDVQVYSSPGRTEVGGNHTDHNAGRVLAAAVDLDILAVVCPSQDGRIVIDSEGYRQVVVETGSLEVVESEMNTTTALVRGVCARMAQLGYAVGGFRACMTSRVPNGSGLSSSAAFELMMVTILSQLYNQGRVPPIQAALIGQFAENHYFGKPCGLMDQTTCAVGGFVTIDFKDFADPQVHKVDYDFAHSGYSLAIIGTGGSHADLTPDYAAIESEMKSVAQFFGGKVLREFSAGQVLANVPALREKLSDRAILRALHFYADDARVAEQVAALERGDFAAFLGLVVDSGRSSWTLLQNVYPPRTPHEQGVALALAVAETILAGRGAWRVHGGGFAGTMQAFVPADLAPRFFKQMSAIFGRQHCHQISIRPQGATRVYLG